MNGFPQNINSMRPFQLLSSDNLCPCCMSVGWRPLPLLVVPVSCQSCSKRTEHNRQLISKQKTGNEESDTMSSKTDKIMQHDRCSIVLATCQWHNNLRSFEWNARGHRFLGISVLSSIYLVLFSSFSNYRHFLSVNWDFGDVAVNRRSCGDTQLLLLDQEVHSLSINGGDR